MQQAFIGAGRWAALLALVADLACSVGSAQSAAPAVPERSPRLLALDTTLGDWPADLLLDPQWLAARSGDRWSLLQLAERRVELAQQIQRGGPAARIALEAWPLSPRAWVERGVVCSAISRYEVPSWAPLLVALRESVAAEDEYGEVLDPSAALTCDQALVMLDRHVASMPAPVFDEYAATRQALGRSAQGKRPRN